MSRIAVISKREWSRDVIGHLQPCVIGEAFPRGCLPWTPESLKALLKGRLVTVQASTTGRWRYTREGIPSDPLAQYSIPNVPFETAVEWLADGSRGKPKYRLSQMDVGGCSSLLDAIRFADLDEVAQGRVHLMWVSGADTVTHTHFDSQHNLYAQLIGTKVFTLFHSDEWDKLYPLHEGAFIHTSAVDLEAPDLAQYPKFATAQPQVVTLTPGQVLFLPAFWWHHVRAESFSVSVNHWWQPELTEYVGTTARTHLLRAYERDGWCQLRMARRLTRAQLLGLADEWLHTDLTLAIVALLEAVEDFVRWPGNSSGSEALRELVSRLRELMAAAVARSQPVIAREVEILLHSARRLVEQQIAA